MARANDTSGTTTSIQIERFDAATLKLDGAQALIECMGIFMSSDQSEQPSGDLLCSAMTGISNLIESAVNDLRTREGGAA